MREPANQRAYAELRDRIVAVKIPPGAMLNEAELTQQLRLGRAPVREAVKRLVHDRLVVVFPRRGTFVAEIRISDARWLTEVREPLEGLAARLAAERRTTADLARIDDVMGRLSHLGDAYSSTDVDRDVHRLVFAMSHNPHLEATLNQYLNLGIRIWYYCLDRLPAVQPHIEAQGAVLDAIKRQDAAAAERLAAQHVRDFLADVQDWL